MGCTKINKKHILFIWEERFLHPIKEGREHKQKRGERKRHRSSTRLGSEGSESRGHVKP